MNEKSGERADRGCQVILSHAVGPVLRFMFMVTCRLWLKPQVAIVTQRTAPINN